jgi:NhaP-type Na+/H+ or K+/H+ antiporter
MPSTPPPLPRWLADPTLPALGGTVLWFLASAWLFGANLFGGRALDELFWTTTAGWLLGLLGYWLFRWQRSAARRGSRSAQGGLST